MNRIHIAQPLVCTCIPVVVFVARQYEFPYYPKMLLLGNTNMAPVPVLPQNYGFILVFHIPYSPRQHDRGGSLIPRIHIPHPIFKSVLRAYHQQHCSTTVGAVSYPVFIFHIPYCPPKRRCVRAASPWRAQPAPSASRSSQGAVESWSVPAPLHWWACGTCPWAASPTIPSPTCGGAVAVARPPPLPHLRSTRQPVGWRLCC